ncbi:TIGR03915 family putative DNA repair protein [Weeksellaceae bacterium TAE3-ERU29]|nr:TIGR03915 family putative DNA repair protein [Weeksellaceae bacterium TAE3-ERU29]
MTNLVYDGTFEGLMTAIFEVFEYRFSDVEITPEYSFKQENLFAEVHKVITNQEKSERVLKKLKEGIGKEGLNKLLLIYLSENERLERIILTIVRQSVKFKNENVFNNLADETIIEASKICKSVGREIHRMYAFVRFEKLEDGVFFSKIEPDFNVLPLIKNHFKNRYKDQKWLIYDVKRNYALFYDLKNCEILYPSDNFNLNNLDVLLHEEEKNYQKLWQRYFIKTGIEERKNTKLHVRFLPKRYWKYLTEKQRN